MISISSSLSSNLLLIYSTSYLFIYFRRVVCWDSGSIKSVCERDKREITLFVCLLTLIPLFNLWRHFHSNSSRICLSYWCFISKKKIGYQPGWLATWRLSLSLSLCLIRLLTLISIVPTSLINHGLMQQGLFYSSITLSIRDSTLAIFL